MSRCKILFFACLSAAVASLAIGFILVGDWLAALATILPTAIMLLANKSSGAWLTPIALLLFIGLAATGVLLNAPPSWLLLGAIFALASWDLTLWGHTAQESFSEQIQLLENRHFRSLLLVIILGSLVVGCERFLRLKVPFWVILLMIFVVFYGLDRIFRQLNSKV